MTSPGKKSAPIAANKANPTAKPKSRLSIGTLFNPNIGASLRPMRESTRMFVQLVAMVFAAHGLFPRNHPALTGDPNARLSLADVFAIARGNLRFTREGLPQVLVFAAVIGCFGLGALALFVTIFSLLVGKAHAQGFAPFKPVDQASCSLGGSNCPDIALGWINYLFFGQQMTGPADYLQQTGFGQSLQTLQPTIIQQALISALGYYSDAILVVAACVLFYHLASMIVETAHHGVAMGKRANQVWAPIRLVVAIGLLVPIASGLNCGQYIVIQLAAWGSNLASETWNLFVQQIAQDQYQPIIPNAPYGRSVVMDLVNMEACATAYNAFLTGSVPGSGGGTGTSQGIAGSFSNFSSQTISLQQVSPGPDDGSTEYAFLTAGQNGQELQGHDFCGHYTIPPMPPVSSNFDPTGVGAAVQNAIQSARQSALQTLISAATTYAQTNIVYFLPGNLGKMGQSLPPNNGIEPIIEDYQNALQQGYQQALQGSQLQTTMQQIANISGQEGWVSAGEWFDTIARVQDTVMDTAALLPKTYSPRLTPDQPDTVRAATAKAMEAFHAWLSVQAPTGQNTASNASLQTQMELAAAGFKETVGDDNKDHWMDKIFRAIDWIATWDGVWQPPPNNFGSPNTGKVFTLGVQFTDNDPLSQIAYFGHANIKTAYDVFDTYIALQILAGTGQDLGAVFQAITSGSPGFAKLFPGLASLFAKATGGAAEALGSVFGTVSVIFFTAGFMLAYFLPLIPFFKFLFGTLTWIVQVLEAIVAVPLIALAHLNPEGDGLPGANGKQSYYFLFNLFLWPVLMIFGLIVGLLLFYLATSVLNMTFLTAVASTGGVSNAHITLSRIAYTILYVVILYMCANNSFKMVDWLPQNCIRWMGAQGLHHLPMGDPTEIQGYMGAAAGYVDSKIVGGAGSLGKAAGPAVFATGDWQKYVEKPINKMIGRGEQAGLIKSGAGHTAEKTLHTALAGVATGVQTTIAAGKWIAAHGGPLAERTFEAAKSEWNGLKPEFRSELGKQLNLDEHGNRTGSPPPAGGGTTST